MGWKAHSLALDVAMHFGTLCAVVVYFRQDVLRIVQGSFKLLRGQVDEDARLALCLGIATLPALLAGFLVSKLTGDGIRNLALMGGTSILFGALLYGADQRGSDHRTVKDMGYLQAFAIGLIQICAFIPGASRSGSCLIALRALGFKRTEAVRFSCLLSLPVILAATVLMGYKTYWASNIQVYDEYALGIIFSLFAGLLSVSFMMHWVEKANFSIFVLYRLLFGAVLLKYAYFI